MDRSDGNPEQFSFARLKDKRTEVLKSGSLWREEKKGLVFSSDGANALTHRMHNTRL